MLAKIRETAARRGRFCPELRYLALRMPACAHAKCLAQSKICLALRVCAECQQALDDARRKLALWRYDYNNVRPHSSLGNQTPAEARRALEQFEGSAHAALAQTDDQDYEIQTRKLSL